MVLIPSHSVSSGSEGGLHARFFYSDHRVCQSLRNHSRSIGTRDAPGRGPRPDQIQLHQAAERAGGELAVSFALASLSSFQLALASRSCLRILRRKTKKVSQSGHNSSDCRTPKSVPLDVCIVGYI